MSRLDIPTSNTTRPVLVAVDFSERAADAFTLACELARRQHRALVVLHVVHGSVASLGEYRQPDPRFPTLPMLDVASERLQTFIAQQTACNPTLEVPDDIRSVLVTGVPANRIIEVAQREGADMIVMGCHGRTGIARLMLGSVAEAVTRHSSVPVTIVKNRPDSLLHDKAS